MALISLNGVFIACANLFCGYRTADAFLEKRPGRLRRWHLPILLSLTAVYLALHIGLEAVTLHLPLALRLLLNLGVTAAILGGILSLFVGGLPKKLFVVAVLFALLAVGQVLYMAAAGIFGAADTAVLGQGAVGVCMVQVMLALGLGVLRRRRSAIGGGARLYLVQSIIPLLSVLMLWLQAYSAMRTPLTTPDLLGFGCILLINFALYYVFEAMETVSAENRQYALQEQRHALLETYYRQMEEHQREIRGIKHDLRNQLVALGAYLGDSDRDRAGEQVAALLGQLDDNTACDFTAHPGANAILGAKYRLAQAHDIVCDFDVKIPADLGVDEVDLASLLGNLLDNAVEACGHCEGQRYIRLRMAYVGSSLMLRCENSTDGLSQNLTSRKNDPEHHGFGMANIRRVVNKYSGQMDHSFTPGSFALELTLHTRKHDEKMPQS